MPPRARSPLARSRRSTSSTSSCAAAPQETLSLDDVVRRLAAERGAVTTERFRSVVDAVAGRSLGAFFRAHIPLHKQPALP